MALKRDGVLPHLSSEDIAARLGIAQDGKPSDAQLEVQRNLRDAIEGILVYANENITDSRAKSLGLTAGEDMLMWLGKALFQPEGIK